MENLFSLLMVMGVSSVFELEKNYWDIVGKLPVEIAVMILRQLDVKSLVSASRVNRRWFTLCHSDAVLRERVRAEIKRQRTAHIYLLGVEVQRTMQNVNRPFASMNGLQNKTVTYISGHTNERVPVRERVDVHPYKKSGKENRSRKSGRSTAVSKPKKGMRL